MKKFFKTIMIAVVIIQAITVTAFAYDEVNNMKSMENHIYNHLENRDTDFTILYTGARSEFEENISNCIKDAYSKDDYLERSWLEIKPKAKVTENGIETTLDVKYLTTKEQENYVDNELKRITNSLINKDMSELEKVQAINEYIINRYEYDYTLKSTSVYSALTTSLAVCQGYAMTAYRMFNYAGIENRIVVGKIKDVSHSWNAVKIQGNWYHIDVTNNDSSYKNKYFLVGDSTLIENNYTWDREKYPKSFNGYYK